MLKLYRFEPDKFDRIETINEGKLFMSHHGAFNDLFDVKQEIRGLKEPKWASTGTLQKAAKILYGEADVKSLSWVLDENIVQAILKWTNPNHVQIGGGNPAFLNLMVDRISKFGMVCFCSNLENPLMWAHYAVGHTGFCVEYEVDTWGLSNGHTLIPINYASNTLDLTLNDVLFNPEAFCSRFIGIKSPVWSYEGEFRFIDYTSTEKDAPCSYKIEYPHGIKPSAVYTGIKAREDLKQCLKSAFEESGFAVPVYEMQIGPFGYQLEAQRKLAL